MVALDEALANRISGSLSCSNETESGEESGNVGKCDDAMQLRRTVSREFVRDDNKVKLLEIVCLHHCKIEQFAKFFEHLTDALFAHNFEFDLWSLSANANSGVGLSRGSAGGCRCGKVSLMARKMKDIDTEEELVETLSQQMRISKGEYELFLKVLI